jgi:hypothetical protein
VVTCLDAGIARLIAWFGKLRWFRLEDPTYRCLADVDSSTSQRFTCVQPQKRALP